MQILTDILKDKFEWAFNAQAKFINEFSDLDIKNLIKNNDSKNINVVVFGPSQVGKTSLILKLIGIADEKIDMSNLSFSGFSKTSSGKLNMGMKVIGDKLITSEYEFGPLTYDIAIKNIDAAAWEKIQDSANKMKVADSPMEQGMQVMGVLPELVKHSPVIEIKQLSLKSSLGDLNADARIKVKGDNPEMLQNILLIGNTLEAEASIVASKSLVDFYIEKTSTNQDIEIETDNNNVSEGADKLSEGQVFLEGEMKDSIESSDNSSGIKSFIDNGYLIPDGKNYSFKASLKQGQVTINGKPVPLAQMMLQ